VSILICADVGAAKGQPTASQTAPGAIRAALFKMEKAGRVEVEGKGKYIVVPQG